jgi:hypothetical protein
MVDTVTQWYTKHFIILEGLNPATGTKRERESFTHTHTHTHTKANIYIHKHRLKGNHYLSTAIKMDPMSGKIHPLWYQ